MEPTPPQFPEIARLISIKRFEVPPPGFHDRLRARVMASIEAERIRASKPWWSRLSSEFNWQRGMAVANGVAFAGLAFLAVGSFHVAHTVINDDEEGQVYAALPLPAETVDRSAFGPATRATALSNGVLLADIGQGYRPMPSSGVVVPAAVTFSAPPGELASPEDQSAPAFLFRGSAAPTKSGSTPRFIFPRSR